MTKYSKSITLSPLKKLISFCISKKNELVNLPKISISKKSNAFEFTIRRNDKAVDYIEQIHPEIQTISIRGCGTVIHVVFQIIEWAIHNGWLIDKSFIGTLTQIHQKNTQRNTTFRAILHRG